MNSESFIKVSIILQIGGTNSLQREVNILPLLNKQEWKGTPNLCFSYGIYPWLLEEF